MVRDVSRKKAIWYYFTKEGGAGGARLTCPEKSGIQKATSREGKSTVPSYRRKERRSNRAKHFRRESFLEEKISGSSWVEVATYPHFRRGRPEGGEQSSSLVEKE